MVVLEKTSFNRIRQMQRFLCYYYLLNSDIDIRSKWEEISQSIKASDIAINNDVKNDCDYVIDNLLVLHSISTEEASITKNVYSNILSIIEKESNWEKKAYNYLDSKTKAHPIVSKLIIALLSVILTGLFGYIIYDALRNDDDSLNHQNTIFIYQNQQMQEICVDKDGFLKIKDVSEYMIKEE